MNIGDYAKDFPGKILRTVEGHDAFEPAPLPPKIEYTPELLHELSRADNGLGRLDGMASWLPDPQLLVRSFIRREALLSSNIEDTFANYEDVARFEFDKSVEKKNHEIREVFNAETAIIHGLDAVTKHDRKISAALINEMHSVLLTGVRGKEITRGTFRNRQVFIGRQSLGMGGARFVPAPHYLVPQLMADLESFIQSPGSMHPIIHAALTHYQFETIHPYEDGNGRMGRVLILLQLCCAGCLRTPALNPSLHFEMLREEYYDALLAVSKKSAWTDWLVYFARGIRTAADDAIDRLDRIRRLRSSYHEKLQSSRASSLLLKLVDELFIMPVLTIKDACRILSVTYPAAKSNVQKLVEAQILEQSTAEHSVKTFVARDVLALLRVERSQSR